MRARQCLKFETDQAQDVKRLEKLNSLFFAYMCGKDPHADADGAPFPCVGRPRPGRCSERQALCTLGRVLAVRPLAALADRPAHARSARRANACSEAAKVGGAADGCAEIRQG